MFNWKGHYWLLFIIILLNLINFSDTQVITAEFRASDIEIIPNIVRINSTGTVNFTCFNHQSNDLPLEANLSKTISSNEIQIFTRVLNKTTIHIRLESINYVGIFYLLCYSKGQQSTGTRADIIVRAPPGVLQLSDKCRVYDRQYIKCIIRATTIARAIQNDYPYKFEFNEISHSPDRLAYRRRVEFLKNESTNETLVFKWQPTIDGEFPDGVRMHMKALLTDFAESSYYFDMTPVFRIKPKFDLQALSSSRIQMNITPISPSAYCEKSILPNISSNMSKLWSVVETGEKNIPFNNLASNSIYRVCMKCRQIYSDLDGDEGCHEIKTLSTLNWFFRQKFFIIFIISTIAVLILLSVILFFWRKKCESRNRYKPTPTNSDGEGHRENPIRYDSSPSNGSLPNLSQDLHDSRSASVFVDEDLPHNRSYRLIANLDEVIAQTSAPEYLPIVQNLFNS